MDFCNKLCWYLPVFTVVLLQSILNIGALILKQNANQTTHLFKILKRLLIGFCVKTDIHRFLPDFSPRLPLELDLPRHLPLPSELQPR